MKIQLSDHFTYKKILLFSLPSIGALIFTSLFSIVDGYFVSNYVGSTAFAGLNLVVPVIMLVSGVGFMFGSGGSALVAMHLGMQEKEKAEKYFSLIVYATVIIGFFLGGICFILAPNISKILGATDAMLPYCALYLRINMTGVAFFMMQQLFQTFLITEGKPKLAFLITVAAGCTNMFLDWLLVGKLGCGLSGAAWATVIGQFVGGVTPLVLFFVRKDWTLHLGKTNFMPMVLLKACGNGISSFLTSVSSSVVGFLYNRQLLRILGENGVASYGVIMYVSFIFASIFMGFTMGVSPVISYQYGADNRKELKNIFRKSLTVLIIANIILTCFSELSSRPFVTMFVGYSSDLCAQTIKGLRIYSVAFLVMGFNVFGSSLFTALNNGKTAAYLSVSRNLVLHIIMIYLLPAILGADGLWAVSVAVEFISLILTSVFVVRNGKNYGYL